MINVFTTEFKYRSGTYDALVSVRSNGGEQSVFVQIYDKSLHHIAPDGELHFQLSNGLRRAAEPVANEKRELIQSIREVVMMHLSSSAASGND
jgi:hypothetical protein